MAKNRTNNTLISLDLLRFYAALFVIYYHYAAAFLLTPDKMSAGLLGSTSLPDNPAPFAYYGWLGVEIFFVISGYVITMSAARITNATDFIIKRFWRLWPTALLCSSLTLIVTLCYGFTLGEQLNSWIRAAIFIPFGPYIDGSYWTLAIEVSFYLIIALIIKVNSQTDRILKFGMMLGLLSLIYYLIAPSVNISNRWSQLALLIHANFFVLGIAIYHWHARIRPIWALCTIPIWLCGCCIALAHHVAERSKALAIDLSLDVALIFFLGPILIIALAPWSQAWLANRLNLRIISTIGLITYPLYLLHQLIGAAMIGVICKLGVPYFTSAGIVAICMIGLAYCITIYLEPILRQKLQDNPTLKLAID